MDRKLRMEELGRPALEEVGAVPKAPVRLILDDIRSRHNVGAIFRTADAFGVEGVLLCGFTPCPPHREIEKTALGATASVAWAHRNSALEAVEEMRRAGYRIWCVEQTAMAVPLDTWDPGPFPTALVLGNELDGVSEEVVAACDGAIVIPQQGIKHSLNVAVCAGVVVYQAVRRISPEASPTAGNPLG